MKKDNNIERASRGERGNALVAALLVMAILVMAAAAGAPRGVAAFKRVSAVRTRSLEKWQARGRAETGLSFFAATLRSTYETDLQNGRTRLAGRVLPAFDPASVEANNSRPVIVAAENGGSTYSGCERERISQGAPVGMCTSILGNINNYLAVRRSLINEDFFQAHNLPAGTVGVADVRVAERRAMSTGGETAYRIEFLLDARGGANGRSRDRGEVIFGVNDTSCATSISTPVAEQTITRGQTASIPVNYTRAKLLVLSANGTEIERRSVEDELGEKTATFTVAPTTDTTYTVNAEGTGSCTAETSALVRVLAPVCPTIPLFDVSPLMLYGGGQVVVRWQVVDAAVVLLNGSPVSATGSMTVTVNTDTTFTIVARDAANSCPQTITKTVRVLPCPSITYYESVGGKINIVRGDVVTLRWLVENLVPDVSRQPGTRILLNGVVVAANGSQTFQPDVTTDYVLRVEVPGASTCPVIERTIRITVTNRPCPSVTRFEPSLSTITEGDTLTVFWNVLNADPATTTIRLMGGGLNEIVPASGSRTLSTLTEGTYTFTLDVTSSLPECPTPIHRQFSVTVNAPPPPPPVPCNVGLDTFNSNVSCVLPGGQVTFTWTAHTNKADTLVQINGAGSYPVNGSATFTVNAAQTFTISISSPTCPATTRSIPISVAQPAPVITSYAPSNSSPYVDEPFDLMWAITGAATATINGTAVNPSSGRLTVSVAVPTDFVLVARSGGCSPQTTQQTIRITPRSCPVPAVTYFRANPPSVTAGGSTVFEWSIANLVSGASVTLTGNGINLSGLPATGTATAVMPSVPGTYYFTISASNACDPSRSVSQQVSVVVTCPAPQIAAFAVNPPTYQAGSRSTINFSWTISDSSGTAVSVSIDRGVGGGLPLSGNVDAPAPATEGTYPYTITARNACGGTSTQTVQVVVTTNNVACAWNVRTDYRIPAGSMVSSTSKFAFGYVSLTGNTSALGDTADLAIDSFVSPYQTSSGTMFPSRFSVSEVRAYNTSGQLVYRSSLSGYIDYTGGFNPGLRIQWSGAASTGSIEYIELDWNMQLYRRDGPSGSDSLAGTAKFISPCVTPVPVFAAATTESFASGSVTIEDRHAVAQMPSGALLWYYGLTQNAQSSGGFYFGSRTLYASNGGVLATSSRDYGSYAATISPLVSLTYIPASTVAGRAVGYAAGASSLRLNPSPTYSYTWDTRFGPGATTGGNVTGSIESIR